jgi:hypothetical protein
VHVLWLGPTVQTAKSKVDSTPKTNLYLLLVLAAMASGAIALTLIVPAIIFFPITIFLGIVSRAAAPVFVPCLRARGLTGGSPCLRQMTSFGLIILTPVFIVFGWLLLSSDPVQKELVSPLLTEALKNPNIHKLLIQE